CAARRRSRWHRAPRWPRCHRRWRPPWPFSLRCHGRRQAASRPGPRQAARPRQRQVRSTARGAKAVAWAGGRCGAPAAGLLSCSWIPRRWQGAECDGIRPAPSPDACHVRWVIAWTAAGCRHLRVCAYTGGRRHMAHRFDTPLASLEGARKHYGKVAALDGVDLELRGGQVLALLGANGAGKTTASSLLLGLLEPDAGSARLFGRAPQELVARQGIGVMLQSGAIADTLTVAELLDLTRSYYPDPRSVVDCVAIAGLDGLLKRRYGKLSGGQQR